MSPDELAQVLYEALDQQEATFTPANNLTAVEVDGIIDLVKVAGEVMQAVAKADADRGKA